MPRASEFSLALTLLALVACGESQQAQRNQERVAEIEVVAPMFERELVGDDGTLLSVRHAISDDDVLFLYDGSADEVWQLALRKPHRAQRSSRPRQFGQSSVFAMASHATGLSLLGVDGSLRVMKKSHPDQLERTLRVFAPIHRPLALGEWTAGGWVAVHSLLVLQGGEVDSVVVSSVDSAGQVGRVFAFERSGPSRVGTFLVDLVNARASLQRVVITGADPARVIIITPSDLRVDTLLGAPERALNASESAELTRLLASGSRPAMIQAARRPERHPAALSALPFDGGYLVRAQGEGSAEFVDLYCGRTFRRTVLARPTLRRVILVDAGVVAVDDAPEDRPDQPDRLAFYQREDYVTECAK